LAETTALRAAYAEGSHSARGESTGCSRKAPTMWFSRTPRATCSMCTT